MSLPSNNHDPQHRLSCVQLSRI